MIKSLQTLDLSRRNLLRGAAMAAGGGALLGAGLAAGSVVAAPTKMSQKASGYQETPMGKARCDNCAQWQAPASCKLVDGAISPAGWCHVYAPKS
jgi:hypothetical protein